MKRKFWVLGTEIDPNKDGWSLTVCDKIDQAVGVNDARAIAYALVNGLAPEEVEQADGEAHNDF